MRDFIHIKDVIRGSLLISKKVKNGRAINLSSGKFISFIDLSKKILKILGKKDLKVLGNSSKPEGVSFEGFIFFSFTIFWYTRADSNCRPSVPQTAALTSWATRAPIIVLY